MPGCEINRRPLKLWSVFVKSRHKRQPRILAVSSSLLGVGPQLFPAWTSTLARSCHGWYTLAACLSGSEEWNHILFAGETSKSHVWQLHKRKMLFFLPFFKRNQERLLVESWQPDCCLMRRRSLTPPSWLESLSHFLVHQPASGSKGPSSKWLQGDVWS